MGRAESRTALVIVGMALVSVALGLLLTLEANPPIWKVLLLAGFLAAGLVLAGISLVGMLRAGRAAVLVHERLSEANMLRRHLLNDPVSVAEAEIELAEWVNETSVALQKRLPRFSAYFLNFASQVHKTYDRGDLDEFLCRLDDHVERLHSILMSLPQ